MVFFLFEVGVHFQVSICKALAGQFAFALRDGQGGLGL